MTYLVVILENYTYSDISCNWFKELYTNHFQTSSLCPTYEYMFISCVCISAAALGNLISDLAGVGTAGYVELLASKVGVRPPDITPAQALSWEVRWSVGMVSRWGGGGFNKLYSGITHRTSQFLYFPGPLDLGLPPMTLFQLLYFHNFYI